MKSNENRSAGMNVFLPLPPIDRHAAFEMEVYVRFMRRIRSARSDSMELCIPTAIACVADMMNTNEAEVSRVLEHLGLRLPNAAPQLSKAV